MARFTYQQLGDLSAARQHLDEAVRRRPRQWNHRYWRALLLLEMGDLQAAWDDLDFARRIDALGATSELPSPNTQRLIYDLIWQGVVCERMGRTSDANRLWNEVAELTEDKNGEFRLALVLLGVLQGETADVVESRYAVFSGESAPPFGAIVPPLTRG